LFDVLNTVEKKIVTYYVGPTIRIMNRGLKPPKLRNVTREELGFPPETPIGSNYGSFMIIFTEFYQTLLGSCNIIYLTNSFTQQASLAR
jgi:hypothetical protein